MKTKEKTSKQDKEVKKPSKRQQRFERRLAKEQEKDFKRYGLTKEDMKDKSAHSTDEVRHGFPSLRKCLKYFKDYKIYVFCVILCALFYVALSTCVPIFTGKLIDAIGVDNNSALWFAIYILIFEVVMQLNSYAWNVSAEVSFQKVIRKLRFDLLNAVSTTKVKKFDEMNSGTIVSRINNDTTSITDVLLIIIGETSNILVGLGFVIYLFFVNVWIALTVVVTTILVALFGVLFLKYNYKKLKKLRVINDKRVGFTNEMVRGMRDIKNLNIRHNIRGKFLSNLENTLRIQMDRSVYGQMLSKSRFVFMAVAEFVCTAVGILLVSLGQMSVGQVLIVIMYYGRVARMIESYQRIQENVRNASIAAERVCEILDDNTFPKESFGTKTIKKPKGKIEFRDVVFGYEENSPVLKGLSLEIQPNQSVAFVGKSGQGKSTLLSLIPKLYEVQGGKILIDDVDITKLSEDGLRDLVTVVPQTPYIFNTSIKENLQFVKPDLTDDQMIDVCQKAQIHDFIMTKQNAYESLLGENGLILSGGQRQRLAIARALLNQSKIILFDEATSALDNENQSKIQSVIENLTKDHTVLVVAHRLSTVVNCDTICMIEGGEIIAKGTHKQLMKTCKPYQKLYQIEQKATELAKEQEET